MIPSSLTKNDFIPRETSEAKIPSSCQTGKNGHKNAQTYVDESLRLKEPERSGKSFLRNLGGSFSSLMLRDRILEIGVSLSGKSMPRSPEFP